MNKTGFCTTLQGILAGLAWLLMPVLALASPEQAEISEHDTYCLTPPASNVELGSPLYKLETEDEFDAIIERGYLRVMLVEQANGCSISKTELQLIEQYAADLSLDVKWVYVENDWNLLPALIAEQGDIIAGQHSSFSSGFKELDFAYTWANSTFNIVQRANSGRIGKPEDLAGRQVAAYKNTDAWIQLTAISENLAGFVLVEIPTDVSYEEVMERVKSGEYDLAVADSLFLEKYLPYNQDLNAEYSLTKQRSMAWAVNAQTTSLKKSLNQYLSSQHMTHDVATTFFDDLSGIKNRGILRVITSSNPSHYYLNNGELYGFEYELIQHYASQHRLRVEVILASSQEEMFQLLNEGKGDVIAASLPSGMMLKQSKVKFSAPYSYANPVLVGRDTDDMFIDLRELAGRRITLPFDSPYWDFMIGLQEQGADFELVQAESSVNMEGTLLMVALGMYDLTVIGSHQYKSRFSNEIGLESKFNLSEPVAHRWAVRGDDKQLLRSLNQYIDSTYRGEHYNIVHAKYFEKSVIPKADDYTTTKVSSLSPYDEHIQKYATEYAFDWRLITALMFQESQFNPQAESTVGAEGLMQLIPATAEFMGVSNTNHPETSINAGVRYLDYLRSKFEESLLLEDRIWFTLASYNAGYGRVKRARQLAEDMGLDKDRWFDNVELAMMKMAQPYKHEGESKRICRCGQTVVYVKEIRTRYFNYIRLTESLQIASARNYAKRRETRIN